MPPITWKELQFQIFHSSKINDLAISYKKHSSECFFMVDNSVKICSHCNKLIAVNTYPRWHGDNCKRKGEEHGKT